MGRFSGRIKRPGYKRTLVGLKQFYNEVKSTGLITNGSFTAEQVITVKTKHAAVAIVTKLS